MRRTMLVGLVLTVAAVVVVLVSAWFDLELEPVALLGVSLGAVVALVPDRTPLMRLAGFAGGLVAAWIGYVARAAMLPDSTGGRAVAVASTSISAVTALLFAAAVGYLATALVAPGGEQLVERTHRAAKPRDDAEPGRLDDMMMEKSK